MKCEIKKKIDKDVDVFDVITYQIKMIPETEEDKQYLNEWDFYIEKFFDKEGNLRLLI